MCLQEGRKMKKINFFHIVLLVVSIIFIVTLIYNYNLEVIEFDIIIGDYVGFNLNPDKIHFGTIHPGDMANRDISISVNKKSKIILMIEDVDFVKPSINHFIMLADEQINITLTAIPGNARKGLYEGKVKILMRGL